MREASFVLARAASAWMLVEQYESGMTRGPGNMLEDLEIVRGEFGPAKAILYARLSTPQAEAEWRISGKVRGPLNDFAETLPTQFSFQDLGSDPTLLSAATIVDPCAWLPESPMRYEMEISLERNGEVIETAKRTAFLKDFAVKGRSFSLGGRRWVPRGCMRSSIVEPLQTWRELGCVRVIRRIDYGLQMECNRIGLPTIVVPQKSATPSMRELQQLACYGSVMIVAFSTASMPEESVRSFAPNLVLAQMLRPGESLLPWVHCAFADAASLDSFVQVVRDVSVPVIACRRSFAKSLTEARAAIDTLQADLAPMGQFAGYVV